MARQRKPENRKLPTGWTFEHGAYYFWPPAAARPHWDGKRRFRLGATLAEAAATWAARTAGKTAPVSTVGDAIDRYLREDTPAKSPQARANDLAAAPRIRGSFGAFPIDGVTPAACYEYVDGRTGDDGVTLYPKQGRREIAFLSAVLSAAVRWGAIDVNPLIGQFKLATKRVKRKGATDEQVAAVLAVASPVLAAYIELKRITGLRKIDLLRVTMSDINSSRLLVEPSKTADTTAVAIEFEMTSTLRAALDRAIAARPRLSPLLFCTRDGGCYIDAETNRAEGFDSMWQRMMAKAPAHRFQESDLRRKNANDSKSLAEAAERLGHADPRVTAKHYRSSARKVRPLD